MNRTFLLFSLLACAGLHAQGDYQVSYFTDDYVEITDAETLDEADWDEPYIFILVDFTFYFGENQVNYLQQLGQGAEWGIISDNEIDHISYGTDLISSAGVDEPGAPSLISWVTDGNPGNRILKIQYKDVAFRSEVTSLGTAENRVNFQMWFHEQGSIIEFRYGPSNIPDPELAYDGLAGPPMWYAGGINWNSGGTDFGGHINGNPTTPELAGFANIYDFYDEVYENNNGGLNSTPAEGDVYRLSMAPVSTTGQPENLFELFPTLAQQEVYLRGDFAPGTAYRIVNFTGSVVASGVLSANRIDVSGLASGMYLMQIEGTSSAQKFVKR